MGTMSVTNQEMNKIKKVNDSGKKNNTKIKKEIKPIPIIITAVIGLIMWFTPHPVAVSASGWHLLDIFIVTIIGCILGAAPMGVITIVNVVLLTITKTLSTEVAFTGYSNKILWLIVAAFCISIGFIKTGLGSRIAYLIIGKFGKSSLGAAYSLMICDLILAPAIPSNTARGAGVVFPIAKSLAESYGSKVGDGTERKIGAFLMITAFQSNLLTSCLFMTAMATSPVVVALAKTLGVDISFGTWTLAASVPGILGLIIIPFIIYKIYPPEMKKIPGAAELAKKELAALGPIKKQEKVMLSVFILTVLLWIFGDALTVDTTVTAFIGLGLLLIFGVISWNDVIKEKSAWNMLFWVGPLFMMATQLSKMGVIKWFSNQVAYSIHGFSWPVAFIILCLVYYYSHFLFASATVHASAMYAPFLAILIGAGAPPLVSALMLGYLTCLYASITHYGTGTAPIYFGTGYVPQSKWWSVGFIVSIVQLILWMGIGMIWWEIIGIF